MAHLVELDLYNFRNFQEQKITFCPKFNFIFGQNASGKTSLLEAIHLLGRGKSFRTNNLSNCIHHNSTEYVLRAQINNSLHYSDNFWLALQRDREGVGHYKVAEQVENKLSNFIRYLPVQFIDINAYKIIEEGPSLRREYLDWLLFHTVPGYIDIWQRMKKSLEQRNILFKSQFIDFAQLELWTNSFILHAEFVDQLRAELVVKLSEHLIPLIKQYYDDVKDVKIYYHNGWDDNHSLQEILNAELKNDIMRKNTNFGPHKADMIILINDHPVKDVFSRGQIKLLTCLMMQARLLILKSKSVFLIDDLSSELDEFNVVKILNSLADLNCQVVVTAIDHQICQKLQPNIDKQIHFLHNSEFLSQDC